MMKKMKMTMMRITNRVPAKNFNKKRKVIISKLKC